MRRVFAHLTSGWQTGPFIHGVFFENPDFPTLVVSSKAKQQQKFQRARGSRETLFFSFYLFISFN
jgi:hypothetical protein